MILPLTSGNDSDDLGICFAGLGSSPLRESKCMAKIISATPAREFGGVASHLF
jgi:hypothetical protein